MMPGTECHYIAGQRLSSTTVQPLVHCVDDGVASHTTASSLENSSTIVSTRMSVFLKATLPRGKDSKSGRKTILRILPNSAKSSPDWPVRQQNTSYAEYYHTTATSIGRQKREDGPIRKARSVIGQNAYWRNVLRLARRRGGYGCMCFMKHDIKTMGITPLLGQSDNNNNDDNSNNSNSPPPDSV